MTENYKNDIINAMRKAFEESGYYEAYQVYNTVRLPYPTDNTKKLVEEAEQTFVGTMAEIKAHLEKIKAESKEKHRQDLTQYNKENSEIRDTLIHLAAEDALPNNVAKNEEFIKATWYYALSKDEPYNWSSEYSEFWEVFQKGIEALTSEKNGQGILELLLIGTKEK